MKKFYLFAICFFAYHLRASQPYIMTPKEKELEQTIKKLEFETRETKNQIKKTIEELRPLRMNIVELEIETLHIPKRKTDAEYLKILTLEQKLAHLCEGHLVQI